MRFAFIHAEKARHAALAETGQETGQFNLTAHCRLFAVSRQGFHAYVLSLESEHRQSERVLCEQIRSVFDEHKGRYGSPRVRAELRRRFGVCVGKHCVERLMRGMGLVALPEQRSVRTTVRDAEHAVAENLLARDFSASEPNTRWVTDITYVDTNEGWAYVAVILDLCSRAVVGWSIDASLATPLVVRALESAIQRRRPAAGLLHHSDRGCQYTSSDYRTRLRELGIEVSMSRVGNCWDNAVAESFFATLKKEFIYRRRWKTRDELRVAVFEYIEGYYNTKRLHSTLGYKTPAEVEKVALAA